ncbi:MDR family MFS transporter [Rhizobium glycinendophyticum]|uniref:MFS transporter n=1 Tax=Rhizobium glycinendophyticum TaxID=2589807 RepID=A0A504UU29_9HYPH|nr:MDR family MFS transporter [Rhizobium glycinendophyticum]TPP10291.1 MFS transporter [Rhizobium glycinendophyticum]
MDNRLDPSDNPAGSGPAPRLEPHPATVSPPAASPPVTGNAASARPAAAGEGPLVTDPRLRLFVYLLLMSAMFMATLDNQIVSTALPTIVGEFGDLERFGWVGSAYLLTTSAVMPLYGKLGDLFGRKYVIMAAISIFTLGSLVCGLAVSMNTLIAARVLQALGGGGIMVSIFSINADLFEPRERARYQSYSSLVLMASGALGPVLGGTLSDLFGWRSIFLVNLPIGIAVLTGLAILLPYRKPHRKPTIDYAGALLLAGAVASIVFWADSAQIFGSLLALQSLGVVAFGVLCAIGWVLIERRAPEPVVPLSLFSKPTINLLLILSIVSGGIGIGSVNYVALFLQTTTGLSPSMAGLLFIATTGGIAIGSLTSGRLIARSGRYKPFSIASAALGVISFAVFSFVHAGTPVLLIGLVMLLQGFGVGIGQQVPVIGVQNAASKADVGAATGTVTLTRMGGAAIAISIYGAIIGTGLSHVAIPLPGGQDFRNLTPEILSTLPDATRALVANAYADAFVPLFMTASGMMVIGLIAALLLPNIRLPTAVERKP